MNQHTMRHMTSVSALYDRHMGPTLFEPYARDLAQRLPGHAKRVIEVAAGTGRVTRHLLGVMPPDGELYATDLNEPMIAEGKTQVSDPRLRWQVADAQALPFESKSANAVVCQFGLMFVPDRALAIREMKRVLTHGGIMLVSTWDDLAKNAASALFQDLVFEAMPDDPPLFMRAPFSLSDPHELERLATEANLLGVRVDTVELTGVAESAQFLAHGFIYGSLLANHLAEKGVDRAALEAKVTERLANRLGDKPLRTPLSAHVLTAFA